MIKVITATTELPKGALLFQTDQRPADDVTAYQFTNWLGTVYFIVVEAKNAIVFVDVEKEYHGEGVA